MSEWQTVYGPDDQKFEFPKSMPQSEMKTILDKHYGKQKQNAMSQGQFPAGYEQRERVEPLAGVVDTKDHSVAFKANQRRNKIEGQDAVANELGLDPAQARAQAANAKFVKGVSFGASDEILGGIQGAGTAIANVFRKDDIPVKEAYEAARDKQRNLAEYAEQTAPGVSGAIELGGGLMTGGVGLARMGAMKGGALAGGTYGAADAEGGLVDRTIGGAQGAAMGALLGKFGEKAVNVVGNIIRNKAYYAQGQLTAAGRAKLEKAGVNPDDFTPEDIAVIQGKMNEGIDPAQAARMQDAQALQVPITKGQVTQSPIDQRFETQAQAGIYGEMNRNTSHGFAQTQNEALKGVAERASQTMTGRSLPTEFGSGAGAVAGRLTADRAASKQAYQGAYDVAQDGPEARIPREHMQEFVDTQRAKLADFDADTPNAERVLDRSDEFLGENKRIVEGPGFAQDIRRTPQSDIDAEGLAFDAVRSQEVLAKAHNLPKKPLQQIIKGLGGVDPKSPLADDLKSAGINPRTAPGLFKHGGVKELDNIKAGDYELLADNFTPDNPHGYMDNEAWRSALRDEMHGQTLRSKAQQELLQEGDMLSQQSREFIEREGIDSTGSVSQVAQRIKDEKMRIARDMEAEELYSTINDYLDADDFTLATAAGKKSPAPAVGEFEHEIKKPSPVTLSKIEGWRKRMSKRYGTLSPVTEKAERSAMMGMMKDLDAFVDKSIDRALVQGDEAAISNWRKARGLFSEHQKKYMGKEGPDKIISKLSKGDLNATEAAGLIFGSKSIGGKAGAGRLAEGVKKLVGEDSDAWKDLKAEAFMRLLNQNGDTFSGAKFSTELERVARQNPDVLRAFFNADELLEMRRFARVSKAVTTKVPGGSNPSGSGIFNMANRFGIWGQLAKSTKIAGWIGDAKNAVKLNQAQNPQLRPKITAPVGGASGVAVNQ